MRPSVRYGTAVKNGEKPIVSPLVILREEFDDWAVLFDPDTGNAFGLNPTGVYVWKLLDGEHSIDDMFNALRGDAHDVPQEAGEHLAAFVEELTTRGLTGYDIEWVRDNKGCLHYCPTCIPEKVADAMQFAYEPPKLVDLTAGQTAQGACASGTSAGASGCQPGASAVCCTTGGGIYASCCGGACDGVPCGCGGSVACGWGSGASGGCSVGEGCSGCANGPWAGSCGIGQGT